MNERDTVLEFEEDFLHLEPFSFAEIPDRWHEGDYIANLDGHEILNALYEAADYVDEEVFEDGPPGMSGTYYKVYAEDVESFRVELTKHLLLLLENTYGKNAKKGMKGKVKPMKDKKAKSKSNYPKEFRSGMSLTIFRNLRSPSPHSFASWRHSSLSNGPLRVQLTSDGQYSIPQNRSSVSHSPRSHQAENPPSSTVTISSCPESMVRLPVLIISLTAGDSSSEKASPPAVQNSKPLTLSSFSAKLKL
jgi:hypothetical protein